MLTPFQLANIPDPLVYLFEGLEGFIISDMSRRIAKTGLVTDSAAYQAMRAQELGIGLDTINDEIAKTLGLSKDAVKLIIEGSTITSLSFDDEVYKKAGLSPTPLRQSPYVMNTIKAVIRQTNGEITNITRSLGFKTATGYTPIAKYYQHACDLAHLKIVNGVSDYKTAIRQAVKECADSGIQFVDYETGWINRADVAVRRAIMSGVRKTTGELAIMRADEFGVTTMELTAHQGARPDHAVWQGQIVDRSGQDSRFLTLDDIGYGTGDGFQGWNCRHDWAPFFPGISPRSWTDEQLKNIDPPPFEYDGKTYSHYEATQKQRRMETAMRRTKRELIGYDAAGDKDYFTAASIKLRRQKEEYAAFSKAAGLRQQKERSGVLGYGHSISQKTVRAEKKTTVAKYKGYLGTKGYKDTMYKLKQIAYNNESLLDGFVKAVDKGDISVLVGIDEYIATARKIEAQLVGLTTKDGVVIRGYATHFVDRIIGQTADPRPGMRQGVSIDAVKEALQSAERIQVSKHKSGKIGHRYYGKEANAIVNPNTGLLIQANPKEVR